MGWERTDDYDQTSEDGVRIIYEYEVTNCISYNINNYLVVF